MNLNIVLFCLCHFVTIVYTQTVCAHVQATDTMCVFVHAIDTMRACANDI